MSNKTYYRSVTIVFAVISVLHILRVLQGWEAVVAGVVVPLWVSIAAAGIAGYLAMRGWQFSQKKR